MHRMGMRVVAAGTALLLLLIATASAGYTSRDLHKSAPNYFDPDELGTEPLHRRFKRAVFSAFGIKNTCPPGWTGQFCENPVCFEHGTPLDPVDTGMDKVIDTLYLPENCAGSYYIPYDSLSEALVVTVTTDAGRPSVNLTDSDGNQHNPDQETGGDGYVKAVFKPNPGALLFSVELRGVSTSLCIVHVEARSKVTFDSGFVFSPSSDKPPFGESSEANVPSYFVAHPFHLSSPAEIKTVTIRLVNYMQPIYRSLLTRRYDCSYEYYAGEFTCQAGGNNYVYTLDGVDDRGFPFRRTRPFACFGVQPTEVPPYSKPTPVPIIDCKNGGQLINNTGTPFCFCKELFTGRQCEQALCMNGGLQIESEPNHCDCEEGFVGQSCENVVCDPNVGKVLTDEKQLIVIIRRTKSMASAIPIIAAAIDDEYEKHTVDGHNVYSGFILISFANGDLRAQAYTKRQFANFIEDLGHLPATVEGNCTDSVLKALSVAFLQLENAKSPVFLFTDVVADQTDLPLWPHIMQQNAVRKLQIYPIFLDTSPQCPFSPQDERFTVLESFAAYSGGLVHTPSLANLQTVFRLTMRTTTYHMNLVESLDLRDCNVQSKSLIIDSSAEVFVVMARGQGLSLTVFDTEWSILRLDPIYTDNSTWFWELPSRSLKPGEFLYSISSSADNSPCAFRMFSQSEFDFFLATTDAIDYDMKASEPSVGVSSHIVAQLNGFYGGYVRDHFRLFAELLITTLDERGQPQPAYYSSGIWRSSCGFHLYFGVSDFCQFDDQLYYATIFIDDDKGYTIQRTSVGYCSRGAIQPPTIGPTGCQHGGVALNETVCLCPAHFIGNKCQEIECQNGGKPASDHCVCPNGVTGTFCEIMTCPVKDETTDVTPDHRSFAIVLSTRFSMKDKVKALADKVDEFARDYNNNNPKWFDYFSIVLVNQRNSTMFLEESALDFASTFKKISQNFDQYTDGDNQNCSVLLNEGIRLALTNSFPNSAIYVFADSPAGDITVLNIADVLDIADSIGVTINFFGLEAGMCTGEGSFGKGEESLASWTGGVVIFTTTPADMFDFISTEYSSGIVAVHDNEQSGQSCNTTGIEFYFPVDAQAKAFTVVALGINPKITVTSPDGNSGLYRNPIIDELETAVEQYIAPCEEHWDANGAYCHRFSEDSYTWVGAQLQCSLASENAFLIDILDQKQYDFIMREAGGVSVWLGLIKTGTTKYDFYYYQPNGQKIPLDKALADKYFAPNQDFTDHSLANVVMNTNDGKWYLAKLTDKHFFICQMHRYGRGFEPTTMNTLIPSGYWKVKVTSDIPTCYAQIRVQSPVQVYYGFVQDAHNDFIRGTANVDSTTNYVVATALGLGAFQPRPGPTPEGKINYVIVAAGGQIAAARAGAVGLPLSPRQDCTFDRVSTPFACPAPDNATLSGNADPVFLKFTGIDQFGYPFERYAASRCDKYITRCYNGGFAHNGACVCPRHYAGADCRVVECENGGKSELDGKCTCNAMYSGKFCEHAMCDPPYPGNFATEGRTLVIALETSFEMSTAIFFLKRNLLRLLNENEQKNPGWIKNYIFYPFNTVKDQSNWYPKVITISAKQVDDALKKIDLDDLESSDTCPRPIAYVLMDIMRIPQLAAPESLIIVITHSAMEDYAISYELVPLLQKTKAQVHFTLIDAPSPCNLGWNNPAAETMQFVSSFTSGSINSLIPTDLTSGFFGVYLPALHDQQLVSIAANRNSKECANAEFMFQIDHGTKQFIVDHNGDNVNSLEVFGPNGKNLTLPPLIMQSSDNFIAVFEINSSDVIPGTYLLRSSSDGLTCSLNVRASSSIQITPGYIQVHDYFRGATQDDAHFAPLNTDKNVIVVHAEGLSHGRLEMVQVITPWGVAEMTAHLIRRDSGCTYTYYSDDSFECTYQSYEVIIFGIDNHGQPFHRNYYTPCVDNRPKPPPPKPSCDLETLRTDLVFMIDTSSVMKEHGATLAQLTFMVYSASMYYTIGAPYAQVGVMSLSDKPEKGGYFNLAQSNDQSLITLLENITLDGGQGQDITLGVESLMADFFTKANGYRTDKSVKHHLVYITASPAPTDPDPANAILALKSNGITGFSLIGINIDKPSDKLLALASDDCRLFVSSENPSQLFFDTANFINNIHCARFPRCSV